MATATYTLTKNGQVLRNNTEIVSREWWPTSPAAISGIGEDYEAMMTLVSNTGAALNGIFDQWLDMSENLSWSATNEDDETTTIVQVSIREKSSQSVVGTANITLFNEAGPPPPSSDGWNPAFQTDGADETTVVNYTDSNKIATVASFSPSTARVYLGASNARSTGRRYLEFEILNGTASQPQLDTPILECKQAGLMPTVERVNDNLPPKMVGVRFNAENNAGNGVYIRCYTSQQTLSNAVQTTFGVTGDVFGFDIDFDSLEWRVYKNGTFLFNWLDFGLGTSLGSLEPAISLPIPTLWSVKLNEFDADFVFSRPSGTIAWGDPEL